MRHGDQISGREHREVAGFGAGWGRWELPVSQPPGRFGIHLHARQFPQIRSRYLATMSADVAEMAKGFSVLIQCR